MYCNIDLAEVETGSQWEQGGSCYSRDNCARNVFEADTLLTVVYTSLTQSCGVIQNDIFKRLIQQLWFIDPQLLIHGGAIFMEALNHQKH